MRRARARARKRGETGEEEEEEQQQLSNEHGAAHKSIERIRPWRAGRGQAPQRNAAALPYVLDLHSTNTHARTHTRTHTHTHTHVRTHTHIICI